MKSLLASQSPPAPRALVLAAGRGERMRPLTDATPKPLLHVQGKPLMAWAMQSLAAAGVRELVVNTAWLGEQIETTFGPSLDLPAAQAVEQPPVRLHYSHEGKDFGGALETLGGICRALPSLSPDGQTPFWVVAGDVFCPGFVFSSSAVDALLAGPCLAHLWLVPNPPHNPQGDFAITSSGLASNDLSGRFTFSSIALYRPQLFSTPYCSIPRGNPSGERAALRDLLRHAVAAGLVSAQVYEGPWTDVGTPERLAELNSTSFNAPK